MAPLRATPVPDVPAWSALAHDARALAESLPDILVAAKQAARTVAFGLHGRRRSGPGETFWQFRRFLDGEPAAKVDWRRSARGDMLYVREKEWEAAHTVFVWPDRSPSMAFKSHLSDTLKRDRALVIGLALAQLLVEGGERVGLHGLTRPSSSRSVVELMADELAHDDSGAQESLPPVLQLPRFSELVVIGDLLDPVEAIEERLLGAAADGARCHLVMVLDPVEEEFPFAGRIEFRDIETSGRFLAGRAETYRDAYLSRLSEQKERLASLCGRLGWSFLTHHTDRSPHEPLLALHEMLSEPAQGRIVYTGSP